MTSIFVTVSALLGDLIYELEYDGNDEWGQSVDFRERNS